MISYKPILQNLPPELQAPLLELAEAVEQNLRQQVSTRYNEIVDVKALANGLLESQQASNQRMARLETILVQLAEAQKRTEVTVKELGEAQKRTEARMEELAEAQKITEHEVSRLVVSVGDLSKSVRVMQPRLAETSGYQLEQRYVERAPSYFGRLLRQIQVLWPGRLDRNLEKNLDVLTETERDEVLLLDAILRGKTSLPAVNANGKENIEEEVYVALEVSALIDSYDVDRASKRAALLRRLGLRVVPVVAGLEIEEEVVADAQAKGVAILQKGKRQGWGEALSRA